MASIISPIKFPYATVFVPFSVVVTTSGNTASTSWAITPAYLRSRSGKSFLLKVTPRSFNTLLNASSITVTFSFNLESENAVTSPVATILPATAFATPTPSAANCTLLLVATAWPIAILPFRKGRIVSGRAQASQFFESPFSHR